MLRHLVEDLLAAFVYHSELLQLVFEVLALVLALAMSSFPVLVLVSVKGCVEHLEAFLVCGYYAGAH